MAGSVWRLAGGLLLLLGGVVAAPAADSPPRPAAAPQYFPLRQGWHWVYRVDDTAERTRETLKVTVRGKRHVPGVAHEVIVVDEHRGTDVADTVPVLYFTDSGFLSMRNDVAYRDGHLELALGGYTPRRILPLTPTRGQTWEETTFTSGAGTDEDDNPTRCEWRYQVMGFESVQVPAGRFANALRIEATARHRFFTYVYTDWYAPDVGLVKSEIRNASRSTQPLTSIQLVKLRRNPDAPRQ